MNISIDTPGIYTRLKEELVTKYDLNEIKVDIIKWVAGMLVAQAAIVATLVKVL